MNSNMSERNTRMWLECVLIMFLVLRLLEAKDNGKQISLCKNSTMRVYRYCYNKVKNYD